MYIHFLFAASMMLHFFVDILPIYKKEGLVK